MNNLNTPQLRIRPISELKERFIVPDYQRGYRWERNQVRKLLDDIVSSDEDSYYLQPIVVSLRGIDEFSLVDGQQRLTTIYLIRQRLTVIKESTEGKEYNPCEGEDTAPKFTLIYQTRDDSQAFLANIEKKKLEDATLTPDYLYMWHAYDEIKRWMHENSRFVSILAHALNSCVKIIWYELPPILTQEAKFEDLNIGKIPLTNSELVKALFMRDDDIKNEKDENVVEMEKSIIVDQWDGVERELHDPMFWGFLTNENKNKYDTLIDIVFNIIAKKSTDEKDDFFTFIHFEKDLTKKDGKKGKAYWDDIFLKYQRLRDWYVDRHLYHLIGYLVVQDKNNSVLIDLFDASNEKTRDELETIINAKIRESIDITSEKVERLNDLKYGTNDSLIERILTLFNVLTTDALKDETERYSFYNHNNAEGGWSLEHIHAQNSEGLNTSAKWKTRIEDLLDSLGRFEDYAKIHDFEDSVFKKTEELMNEMRLYIDNEGRRGKEFEELCQRYYTITESYDGRTSEEYRDEMSNMALLSKNDNAMLNNSVFDIKRNKIIKKAQKSYIPICTQRVFLKAFPGADDKQFFYWGDKDRKAYIDVMERTILEYLPEGYETEEVIRNKQKKEQ